MYQSMWLCKKCGVTAPCILTNTEGTLSKVPTSKCPKKGSPYISAYWEISTKYKLVECLPTETRVQRAETWWYNFKEWVLTVREPYYTH